MKTVTVTLTDEEQDLIFRYCVLRAVKGALLDPEQYEAECIEALQIFDRIQNKLKNGLRASFQEPHSPA